MSALGEPVTVWVRVDTGEKDEMGERVFRTVDHEVENVLIRPLTPAEVADSKGPDGERATCVLAFPQSYDGPPLEHARVAIRGQSEDEALHVIGVPIVTDPCPTDWNMLVTCGVRHG